MADPIFRLATGERFIADSWEQSRTYRNSSQARFARAAKLKAGAAVTEVYLANLRQVEARFYGDPIYAFDVALSGVVGDALAVRP